MLRNILGLCMVITGLILITGCPTETTSTTYTISIIPAGAAPAEALSADVSEALESDTVTLTAALGSTRQVALSADGLIISPPTISAFGGTAAFTMPAGDVEITAIFSDIPATTYAIKISPSGAASGETVNVDMTEAAAGATVTLTASLNSFRQVALSASGVAINPSVISTDGSTSTFTMPAGDVEIVATFSMTYGVTVIMSGAAIEESVSADVTEAAEGAIVTMTASLNSGRQVVLSAAGETITPATISANNGTATFIMPASAVEVTAAFSYYAGGAVGHSANSINFNMHYVPSGGPFIMGEHVTSITQSVTLTKNFWMGETVVTQELCEDVWGTNWPGKDSLYGTGADYPTYVTWFEAAAFCNLLTLADSSITDTEQVYYSDAGLSTVYTKANAENEDDVYVEWSKTGYRLPTSAEWEYAARYIDGSSWNNGDHASGDTEYACYDPGPGPVSGSPMAIEERISEYCWWSGNNSGSYGDPTYISKEVGQKTANALGMHDMSGNVDEWCYDWGENYSGGSETDPKGPESGTTRVYRGGSWYSDSRRLRCAALDSLPPDNTYSFRLCRTADQNSK